MYQLCFARNTIGVVWHMTGHTQYIERSVRFVYTFECENDLQSASNTHARQGFFQPFDAKNDFYAKKVSPVVHSISPVQ